MNRRVKLSPAQTAIGAIAFCVLAWLLSIDTGVHVPTVRAEFVTITALVITTIAGLFKGLFGGVSGPTKNALLAMRDGVAQLGNRIADVAATAGSWFKSIFDSTKKLYSRVIKPFLLRVAGWIRSLQQLLAKWFGPIIKVLKRVRDDVLKFYRKILRPILDTIDIVSKTLKLLGLFGWDAATRAAEKLDDFSDRIEGAVLQLVRELNKIITQVDRILTFDGIFQRITLLQSLIRYRNDVAGIALRATYRNLSLEESMAYFAPGKLKPIEEHIQQTTAAIEFGSGPLAPKVKEAAADVVWMLRAA